MTDRKPRLDFIASLFPDLEASAAASDAGLFVRLAQDRLWDAIQEVDFSDHPLGGVILALIALQTAHHRLYIENTNTVLTAYQDMLAELKDAQREIIREATERGMDKHADSMAEEVARQILVQIAAAENTRKA